MTLVGRVASWRGEKGWGTLWSPELDGKVWAHYSMIVDMDGYRDLDRGDFVAFTYEEAQQDGYSYRAEWVRRLDGDERQRTKDYLVEFARWQETGNGPRPVRPDFGDIGPAAGDDSAQSDGGRSFIEWSIITYRPD